MRHLRGLSSFGLVAGLAWLVVAGGCASPPAKGPAPAAGAAARRPDGVRPDVGPQVLEPRGLDLRWSFYLGERVTGMWALDDSVYVFTAKQKLYSLGLDDGYVRWVYEVKADLSFAPATYSYRRDGIPRKDELFIIARDVLHCIDKDAGFALWKKTLPFAAASPPAASISHVYIGSWDGRLYAIDKDDESIDWSYRTNAPVTARADAAEKTVEAVYFGSEDGNVYSMNPIREERKWFVTTRGAIVARPVFFRNYVYVGSKDFNLYCIQAMNGNLDWCYPTGAPITKEPVAYSRDTIYVISGDSTLLAVNLQPDVKKDYVRWRFNRGIQVLAKGRRDVYVLDTNNDIVSLADETGKERWSVPLRTDADFTAMNPYDPRSLIERERRLASTIVLGYHDGWLIAVKEKSEF